SHCATGEMVTCCDHCDLRQTASHCATGEMVTCCDHCDLRQTASHCARQARDNTLDPPRRGLAEPAQQELQVARSAKGVDNASPSCEGRESSSRFITANARYRAQGGAGGAGTGRLDRGPTHAALPQWI